MKLSQAKEYLPFVQAAAEGKRIQYKSKSETSVWVDLDDSYDLDALIGMGYIRIKPTEPILRPWKPEEVPVGALLKNSYFDFGGNPVSLIIGVRGVYVYFLDHEKAIVIESTSIKLMDSKYTYSIDHGKTWLPCGIME
jgi:hypothetical protein